MAIKHNWETRGLHTQYLGQSSGDELVNAALAVSGDRRFDELQYVIGDWSQSTASSITEEDVEKLVACIAAMSHSNPNILNPSVLPPDEHRQAMVSFYVMLTEHMDWETDWFHTEEEARDWIARKLAERSGQR